MADDYKAFIERKTQAADGDGFAPVWLPEFLFDFQRSLVDWSLRKGRAALFVDTGMGKTAMQLVWAENIVRHTGRPVLILAPLAVSAQTIREGQRFGITVRRAEGRVTEAGIYVLNYERLHHVVPEDFAGLVCDESSILKSATGETKKAVVRFALKLQYRLLATATPSPNDYVELGTSSEALGYLGYSEMLTRFFKQTDAKGSRIEDVKRSRKDRELEVMSAQVGGNYYGKLSYRVSQDIGKWRMKGHAVVPFWRWVASWARACRKPSDVGEDFDDARFVLPPLEERHHVVKAAKPPDGQLFTLPAFGLQEERDERRRTLDERCQLVASLCQSQDRHLVWCHLNSEGDKIESLIPGAVQVSGADSDDFKEAAVEWFQGHTCVCGTPLFRAKFPASDQCGCGHKSGRRVLVSKATIFGYGINLQTCAHVVTFASHSWEQHYQCIRRCWRFGQTRRVTVDIISTDGEVRVRESMQRKGKQAEAMFAELVAHMQDATRIARQNDHTKEAGVIPWL